MDKHEPNNVPAHDENAITPVADGVPERHVDHDKEVSTTLLISTMAILPIRIRRVKYSK